MWQTLTEIKTIFDNHDYNFNNIILDNFKKFKLKSAFNKYGFTKTQGFPLEDIVIILMLLQLLSLNTIHNLYKKHYNHIATMQKETLYRFINNDSTDWPRILLYVAKMFNSLTNSRTVIRENSALILDDASHLKTGATIEKISYVFDHVLRKTVLGFKNLTLAHFDGISYKVVDFSLHSEKKLTIKNVRNSIKARLLVDKKHTYVLKNVIKIKLVMVLK